MKMLDFNAIQQPTWPIKLRDEAKTIVNLSAPTVELFDRLAASTPALQEAAKTKDGATIRALYELLADLINNNEDGITVTAEELRDKYRLKLYDVIVFYAGYMDFVKEIQEAKN